MKKILPGLLIAFVSGFMFFLFEPINMYATNTNDFWFDFYIMIKPTVLLFLAYFLAVFILYIWVFLINRIFSKKVILYKTSIIIGFALLIAFYIQGNFLIGGLPPLDGSTIVWSEYHNQFIISLIVWIVVFITTIVLSIVLKFDKASKFLSFITITIFIMLSTSLISTVTTNEVFYKKDRILTSTIKNINTASNNKNLFIFVLDAVDSKCFDNVLKKSEDKDVFNDFTYYPDTICAYPFTRDSIPFMLSGIWNENKTGFDEYSNNALDSSKLFDKLISDNYSINLYEDELVWNTDKALNVDNLYNNMGIIEISYVRNILKYVGFKYLPYQLKSYSKIETLNFNNCRQPGEIENYSFGNIHVYNNILNEDKFDKIDQNYFNFMHIEGGHYPFNLDKNIESIPNGTYDQKLEGCITIVKRYIQRLKENDCYDNSAIIILADHGYNFSDYVGRQNPILFIKGIDEHHDEMVRSDLPISYEDLIDAYIQLLDGDKSEDLFNNIDVNRKRRFLLYEYEVEDHMEEFEQTGTADNEETLIPTGRVFDR